MKDARFTFFSRTLEDLLESLDATLRVKGWTGEASTPPALQESASRLLARLGTADRLTSKGLKGSQADLVQVTVMLDAMRRLDTAYVAYCRRLQTPAERGGAATALGTEIHEVRAKLRGHGLIRGAAAGSSRSA
jgi:hypothetical protein